MAHRPHAGVRRPLPLLLFLALLVPAGCGDEGTGVDLPPQPEGPLPTGIVQAQIDWLRDHLHPFEAEVVRSDRSDLAFLSELVGDARVVGLGEATHGSRNIFTMKHRILDYLVREEGFRHFAIEASMPEMFRIDDWVKGGEGDPAVLLSGQYFWTWRTEAVLDLLVWAREYNTGRPPSEQVSVVGFDMQHPGMAVYNIRRYLEPIDPEGLALVNDHLACFEPYLNGPAGSGAEFGTYELLDAAEQDACRSQIDGVRQYLLDQRSSLADASSEETFEYAVRNARLVEQSESQKAGRSDISRDHSMAENTLWLMDRAGPESRWVLWAHNGHIVEVPHAQGGALQAALGADYLSLGFAFLEGSFRANNAGSVIFGSGLVRFEVGPPPEDTYETVFAASGVRLFMLDLRARDRDAEASGWLFDPERRTRWVGASYNPARLDSFLPRLPLGDAFDVVVYQRTSEATRLLPDTPPDSFGG